MKEFCLVPKAIAERFLRPSPTTGSDCKKNSNNDVNNNRNTNKPVKNLKRISSAHKTTHLLPIAFEGKSNNKNNNIHRQHRRVPKQNRHQLQPRSQRVAVAKDAIFPPKVKLMMTKKPTSTSAIDVADPRPNLDKLINISATTNTSREYIKSFLSVLRNTPAISWDASGNLLEPFRRYNIIHILKTLGDVGKKQGFEKEDVPFIRMILRSANMDPSFIRNNQAKKQLMGGSKSPHPPQRQWERYRL